MANNYLQFSEVIPRLSESEEAWLREQLEVICVRDGKEYPENALPNEIDTDAITSAPRSKEREVLIGPLGLFHSVF
jgi:hypothetical protein